MARGRSQDRISELPEELKLFILRLLPRKYAIRTGVLSMEWKDLWKRRYDYPTLLEFSTEEEGEKERRAYAQMKLEQMQQFACRRMEFMRLFFCVPKDCEKGVFSWIINAIGCGVEEVNIDFSQGLMLPHPSGSVDYRGRRPELREFLFKDNCVVHMNLRYCRLSRRFRFVSFTSLEILKLHAVNITSLLFDRLLISCINLKTVVLSKCNNLEQVVLNGQDPQLRNVGIFECSSLKYLNLRAPNLWKFQIVGYPPHLVIIEDAFSLVDLSLYLSLPTICDYPLKWRINLSSMIHLQTFSLCSSVLEVISQDTPTMFTSLPNLRRLTLNLTQMTSIEMRHIYRFFKCCSFPLLEELSAELLNNICPFILTEELYSTKIVILEAAPDRIFEHLCKMELINFSYEATQLSFVDFFLDRVATLTYVTVSNHLRLRTRHRQDLLVHYLEKRLGRRGLTGVVNSRAVVEVTEDPASGFP